LTDFAEKSDGPTILLMGDVIFADEIPQSVQKVVKNLGQPNVIGILSLGLAHSNTS
jgi:hypothetical protein